VRFPKDKVERDMKRLVELERRHKEIRAIRPSAPNLAAKIDRLRKKLKLPLMGDMPYNHQRTNTERSLDAEAALRLFVEKTGQEEDLKHDPMAPISDLICNLRHYADRLHVPWADVMESAMTNYNAERYCAYCKSPQHGTDECIQKTNSP
jgi:hypothetical protein